MKLQPAINIARLLNKYFSSNQSHRFRIPIFLPSKMAELLAIPEVWSDEKILKKFINSQPKENHFVIASLLKKHNEENKMNNCPALIKWIDEVLPKDQNIKNVKSNIFRQFSIASPEIKIEVSEKQNDAALDQKDRELYQRAKQCLEDKRGLGKIISPHNWKKYVAEFKNHNIRDAKLRRPVPEGKDIVKFIHLTEEIVPYQKKRRAKSVHDYMKKSSYTYLSSDFATPPFGRHDASRHQVGVFYDKNESCIKAMFTKDRGTYLHKWIGTESQVKEYAKKIKPYNCLTYEKWTQSAEKNREDTNEGLVKTKQSGLRAILIGKDDARNRAIARCYKADINEAGVATCILIYDSFKCEGRHYTLAEQEQDKNIDLQAKQQILNIKNELEKTTWNLSSSAKFFKKLNQPKGVIHILNRINDSLVREEKNDVTNIILWTELRVELERYLITHIRSSSIGRASETSKVYQNLLESLSFGVFSESNSLNRHP